MDEWEAKCKLAFAIIEKETFANVELLFNTANKVSKEFGMSLDAVVNAMLKAASEIESKTPRRTFHGQFPPQTILGFPVSLQSWMPSHYAAIGNGEGFSHHRSSHRKSETRHEGRHGTGSE